MLMLKTNLNHTHKVEKIDRQQEGEMKVSNGHRRGQREKKREDRNKTKRIPFKQSKHSSFSLSMSLDLLTLRLWTTLALCSVGDSIISIRFD